MQPMGELVLPLEVWWYKLGRAGPTPCLGGVGEVALVARYRRAGPNGIGVGDLAPYLAQVAQESQQEEQAWESERHGPAPHLARDGAGSGDKDEEAWQADSSTTTQAQIQGFELTFPNIFPIQGLLEGLKRLDPVGLRATAGYLRVSINVQYKPEALNQAGTRYKEHLQVKLFKLIGQNGKLCDTPRPPVPLQPMTMKQTCRKDGGVEWSMRKTVQLIEDQVVAQRGNEMFLLLLVCLFLSTFGGEATSVEGNVEGMGNE